MAQVVLTCDKGHTIREIMGYSDLLFQTYANSLCKLGSKNYNLLHFK